MDKDCNGGCQILLDSVNVLFEAIIWAMEYLYKKTASARLSSDETKYSYSSTSWLDCWNPAWVAFKFCFCCNSLYSNTENILKLAHVLSTLGFLRQLLHASGYITEDLTAR